MNNIDLIIVEWIQSFRNDFWDAFFLFITEFGDETVFLIIAAILYWTVDKRFAQRFILFFLYSAILNGVLKFLTNRPRPYVASPETVDLVGDGAGGTSLPSGHAQNSAMMGFVLSEKTLLFQRGWSRFLTIIVGLVMLSRLYLGEHYLSDVIFGLAIAYSFYTLINSILNKHNLPNWLLWLWVGVLIPVTLLANNKDLYVALATIIGVQWGLPWEMRHIGFQEKTTKKYAILRIVIGIVIALLIRIGLKEVFSLGLYSIDAEFNPILTDHLLDFVRYFIITLWMTIGAPWLFKRFLSTPSASCPPSSSVGLSNKASRR